MDATHPEQRRAHGFRRNYDAASLTAALPGRPPSPLEHVGPRRFLSQCPGHSGAAACRDDRMGGGEFGALDATTVTSAHSANPRRRSELTWSPFVSSVTPG